MTETFRDLARAKATFQARALRAILTEQLKGKPMKDKAPERIWADDDGVWRGFDPEGFATEPVVEYARADLLTAAQAENDRLKEALTALMELSRAKEGKAYRQARAALQDGQ